MTPTPLRRFLRGKGIAATDIAKMFGVARATVYRYLAERRYGVRRATEPNTP
jgi:predicted transcriptional regulator